MFLELVERAAMVGVPSASIVPPVWPSQHECGCVLEHVLGTSHLLVRRPSSGLAHMAPAASSYD